MLRNRTTAATLCAALLALTGLALLDVLAAPAAHADPPAVGTLLINEVQVQPPPLSGVGFIELYNPTSQAVDLGSTWYLRAGGQNQYLSGTVGPGQYFSAPVLGDLPLQGGPITLELTCTYCGDNGAGGYRDIDKVTWNARPDVSVGRCPDGAGGTPGVLSPTVYPTNGAANVCTNPIVVNEVVAPSTGGGTVELKNVTGSTVSLDGWGVVSSSGAVVWLDGSSIAAGGYRTVSLPAGSTSVGIWKDTRPAPHNISGSYGIDGYQWSQPAPTSYGRCPDGTGGFAVTSTATLGAANVCPSLQNQTPPVISGTARVAETLSLTAAGQWAPPPAGRSYQWLADGVPVDGATGTTLTLAPAQAGAMITLRETVSGNGSTAIADSNPLGPVEPGTITSTTRPVITGEPSVGQTLSVSSGSWSPGGVDTAYQWLVGGEAVDGATASTYTVRPVDVGSTVTARVTASKPGYTAASVVTDPTAPVAGGFALSSAPTVTGVPTVGNPLTATSGTWEPSPATTGYQWRRDGTEIPGATDATYTPVAADAGALLSVAVVVTAPGYLDGHSVATASGPVRLGTITSSVRPVISGVPETGKTLTASPGTWSVTPDHVTYRWYAGRDRITGATGPTLVLDRPALVDQRISVSVEVSAAGYAPNGADAPWVGPVTKSRPRVDASWSTRTPQVRTTKVRVDVVITTRDSLPLAGQVSLLVDGSVVDEKKVGDGRVELVAPAFRERGRHKMVVRYSGSALLASWQDIVYVTVQQ